jgi:sugar transferase (PEP-CTERM system associated)
VLRVFRHYVPGAALGLVLVDLLVVLGSVWLAGVAGNWLGDGILWPKVGALLAVTMFILYLGDLYRTELRMGRREVVARLLVALSMSALLMAAVGFALPALRFGRLAFLQIFGVAGGGLLLIRLTWEHLRSTERLSKRVLVLGLSTVAQQIVGLQSSGLQPFSVLGFLDDAPDAHDRLPAGAELLGKTRDMLNLIDELHPDLVLVALPDMRGALPTADLLECRLSGITVEDWPTFYEKQTGKILVTGLRPSWLIFCDGFVKTSLTQTLKRTVDVVLSLVGLALAMPLMALVAILVKLDSQGPVLFRQARVGQNGRIFVLNKFRSMRQDAERASGAVWATRHDPRITRIGGFLRKTRLDELPQLFNVLAGHMSFVGPRPERPEFVRVLQREIPFYLGRLAVKPGITGWAQVRHRYAASVEDAREKLQYDLYYIKNLSPLLDLLILVHTVQVVLFARGAR